MQLPEITEPIKEQLDNIIHSSTLFLIRAQIELAERIKAMTPEKLNKVFFTNSGTEANEAAFLITTLNRSSNELIALRHSYHGRSFATINASGQRGWRSSSLSPLARALCRESVSATGVRGKRPTPRAGCFARGMLSR